MPETKPKRKTRTSAAVITRYEKKVYDRFLTTVRKGEAEMLNAVAAKEKMSRNELITTVLSEWLTARGYEPVMVKEDDELKNNC